MWFPPGQWTDWFTGATFTGPSEQTLTVPLDRTGVFVKAGGIVPEQAPMSHVGARPDAPTIIRVYPGAPGQFSLYQDAGTGTGYQHREYTLTAIDTWSSPGRDRVTRVSIGPAVGRYPGEPSTRSFSVRLDRLSAPDRVLLDGRRLPSWAWRYDAATDSVIVPVNGLSLRGSALITVRGSTEVSSPEPAAVELGIDPSTPLSLAAGTSTTVTTSEHNDGPGAARGLSVALSAPVGWTVTPASPVHAGDLSDGGAATQSWTVTAPAGSTSPATAALQAQATSPAPGGASG